MSRRGGQTFTVNTNASDTARVWAGVNYSGDGGRLGRNGCNQGINSGNRFADGSTVTLRGCKAGTATICIYRSSVVLATYTVTVS